MQCNVGFCWKKPKRPCRQRVGQGNAVPCKQHAMQCGVCQSNVVPCKQHALQSKQHARNSGHADTVWGFCWIKPKRPCRQCVGLLNTFARCHADNVWNLVAKHTRKRSCHQCVGLLKPSASGHANYKFAPSEPSVPAGRHACHG